MTETQFAQSLYGQITPCPAGQCNGKTGGNTALKPETADTVTLGTVLTPHFIRGFYASVDYWDINVMDAIGTLPFTGTLAGCYNDNISALCNSISRDPSTGTLTGTEGFVSAQEQNLSSLHKRGWDFQMDYHFRLRDTHILPDWGSVDLNMMGTYLVFDKVTVPVEGQYNCAGQFGATCGQSDPHWRHQFRATWATPWKVDLSLRWRYIAQVLADVNSTNPNLNGLNSLGAMTTVDAKIPAYSYFDLTAQWRVRDNISLRLGVNNIFDKDPPILDTSSFPLTAGSGNTYPGLYDPLGRTIFINLTAKY
jgi:outer membrane receptor protein involved in Fe transport